MVLQMYREPVALWLLLLQKSGHAPVLGARLKLPNEGVQVLELVGNLLAVALVRVLMDILRIDGGFTLRRRACHVDGMAREVGMETAKPSRTPEVNAETRENTELLSTWEHRMYRNVFGIPFHHSDCHKVCSS